MNSAESWKTTPAQGPDHKSNKELQWREKTIEDYRRKRDLKMRTDCRRERGLVRTNSTRSSPSPPAKREGDEDEDDQDQDQDDHPAGGRRWRKEMTDRALRYRANASLRGPRICNLCGAT